MDLMDNNVPVFETWNMDTNAKIKIYRNGKVEGLPEGYGFTINRIPQLEIEVYLENKG